MISCFLHFFGANHTLNIYNQQLKQIMAVIFPILKKELKGVDFHEKAAFI